MDSGLPPKPSRDALVAMCRDEPEKAADLILMLWDKVEQLALTVAQQGSEIADLKAKLAKDSHNSSKPPSSDKHNPGGPPPPKARRGKGNKKAAAGTQRDDTAEKRHPRPRRRTPAPGTLHLRQEPGADRAVRQPAETGFRSPREDRDRGHRVPRARLPLPRLRGEEHCRVPA